MDSFVHTFLHIKILWWVKSLFASQKNRLLAKNKGGFLLPVVRVW
jgi:hypothetical protein